MNEFLPSSRSGCMENQCDIFRIRVANFSYLLVPLPSLLAEYMPSFDHPVVQPDFVGRYVLFSRRF